MTEPSKQPPRFVNRNSIPVYVPKEGGGSNSRMIRPFVELQARPADAGLQSMCVVTGEFYAQFAGEGGPLSPFPEDFDATAANTQGEAGARVGAGMAPLSRHTSANASSVRPTSAPALDAQASPSSAKLTGDVVDAKTGEVKVEDRQDAVDQALTVLAGSKDVYDQLIAADVRTLTELASPANLPKIASIRSHEKLHNEARVMLGLPVDEDGDDDGGGSEVEPTSPVATVRKARKVAKKVKKSSRRS